jgi:ATP-dependent RNA helicase DDX24/MAK5
MKDLYLYAIILLKPRVRTIVFVNSISAVRRLAPFLQNLNMSAQSLHSGMEQKARLRTMEKFSATPNAVLIATDVAARGLDIPHVGQIIHYHVPRSADMYIHRSGRTARGEEIGTSVVICSPEEVVPFRRLVASVHAKAKASKRNVQDLSLDGRVISRLKQRSTLAKKIADVTISKEIGGSEKDFFREAAEDLGVEYDSDELENPKGKRGRGNMRRAKQMENKQVSKGQLRAWKAELAALLSQRVNVGVSEKYIAQGIVDVDALLNGKQGEFLGNPFL